MYIIQMSQGLYSLDSTDLISEIKETGSIASQETFMIQPLTPKHCPEESCVLTETGLPQPQSPDWVTGIICEENGPGQDHGIAHKEERQD